MDGTFRKRGLVLEKYRYILLRNSLVAVTNYEHFNLKKKNTLITLKGLFWKQKPESH